MWVTLDFEASGLSLMSYPIEVGYVLPNGDSQSFLIDPSTASGHWHHWDHEAESRIHGISQKTLATEGTSVLAVCQHLNQTLAPFEHVLCDSQWDLFWMGRLYKACYMRPSFTLMEVNQWLKKHSDLDRRDFSREMKALGPAPHRAVEDALQIRRALESLLK
ncbi:hypothetical protein BZG79_12945 [Salinivibrio sp. MA427]|jgi:hypothetical protein|uniref:hypothetical protein n=1 Tax=Salinivibrio TaxID=51366 RepID=UPI00046F7316|nr:MULTISPECIES: hypothetical protein [Salinivibrio]NUY56482.1 hypothetical protein [Salinivibrio sp. EAGSL]OOE92000.1 hypothetical protein BZG76_09155 [Salinivibrio sp. AR647]OOF03133.1 hypothetical protein BZG80_10850 [Salinivibrio sp. MA440]OOF03947.1 hypothetical protein BZG81_10580 [Salinivibrio sp. MA607]OOF07924.1 hypothetical protein BZG79_12945 [Salinivibrio sp. MA427]